MGLYLIICFARNALWSHVNILLESCSRAGCGYGSESEGEEAVDGNVTLPQSLPGKGNMKSQKSAIRLTEVRIDCSYSLAFNQYID